MLGRRFSSSVGAVGIDLGSDSIKMLQVRDTGEELRVVGAARIDAPGDVLVPRPDQIASAFSAGGFTGRRCVVNLPRADVHVQSIRMPRMPEREMRQAVAWEASQRFEMDRDAMQVDYLQTGAAVHGCEDREETLLIAVANQAVERHLEPLLEAGLRPVAVDTAFTAMARALSACARRDTDRLEVRAVVEIGASGSSLMILQGDNVRFYKPLSIRGSDLNKAVVEHLQIDAHAAAELRVARIAGGGDRGPTLDASTDRAVYEAVRPRLNELVKEIVLCLRYYGVTFRGQPPAEITLAGGDSLEPHLDELVEQSCKMPVRFDDARGTIGAIMNDVRTNLNRSPGPPAAWLVAAGLSMRELPQRKWSGRSSRAGDERAAA